MAKRQMRSGDEYDALIHRIKRYFHWKPGERKRIKTLANRRDRREAKLDCAPLLTESMGVRISPSLQNGL